MKIFSLTSRQTKWVGEYLACGNATYSAVKAGYSVNGASVAGNRMLRNVRVQEALQARQNADAIRLSVQREDVLAGLLEAVDTARHQQNPMAMISGLRELGRMLGFYTPEVKRLELTSCQNVTQNNITAMTDAQLLALI